MTEKKTPDDRQKLIDALIATLRDERRIVSELYDYAIELLENGEMVEAVSTIDNLHEIMSLQHPLLAPSPSSSRH